MKPKKPKPKTMYTKDELGALRQRLLNHRLQLINRSKGYAATLDAPSSQVFEGGAAELMYSLRDVGQKIVQTNEVIRHLDQSAKILVLEGETYAHFDVSLFDTGLPAEGTL